VSHADRARTVRFDSSRARTADSEAESSITASAMWLCGDAETYVITRLKRDQRMPAVELDQYQSANVVLSGGTLFAVSTTGRVPGYFLRDALKDRRKHLGDVSRFGDREDILSILVQPEILFLDVKGAIERSRLLARGLRFRHIMRPAHRPPSRRQVWGAFYYVPLGAD